MQKGNRCAYRYEQVIVRISETFGQSLEAGGKKKNPLKFFRNSPLMITA
jgi:hypothetical protein